MSDDIYTAQCILKKRFHKGRTEYFIKWQDWSSKYNSWEPVENILDRRLILNFEKKQTKSKPASRQQQQQQQQHQQPAKITKQTIPSRSVIDQARTSQNQLKSSQDGLERDIREQDKLRKKTAPIVKHIEQTIVNDVVQPRIRISVSSEPNTSTLPLEPKNPKIEPLEEEMFSESSDDEGRLQIEEIDADQDSTDVDSNDSRVKNGNSLAIFNRQSLLPSESSFERSPTCNQRPAINDRQTIVNPSPYSKSLAILNTVITDVTFNQQTVTISESEMPAGFFKSRGKSVAVETAE